MNLCPNHQLFLSDLWRSDYISDAWVSKVQTGCFENEVTTMRATGIPPRLLEKRELQQTHAKLDYIVQHLSRDYISASTTLPATILQNVQDTVVQNNEMLRNVQAAIVDRNVTMTITEECRTNAERSCDERTSNTHAESALLPLYTWNGALHPVPEEWHMPTGPIKSMFAVWFQGVYAEMIPPLRKINPKRDLTGSAYNNYVRTRMVIEKILTFTNCKVEVESMRLDKKICDDRFMEGYTKLCAELFGKYDTQHDKISALTLYRLLKKAESKQGNK